MNGTSNLLFLFSALLWVALCLGPLCLILWLGYFVLSQRLRRQERARLFFSLLEFGLSQGRRVEETIISVSDSRDESLGIYFHLLAFYLKEGLTFGEALKKVPRLVPPKLAAMLQAGLKIGDLGKVFPACRRLFKDAVSQTRSAINYLVLSAFVGIPANLAILTIMQIKVFPLFVEVGKNMGVPAPPGILFLMDHRALVFAFQALLCLVVWSGALIYLDAPGLPFVNTICSSLRHRIVFAIPWRRKRLQRDFSAMLAILIDAGMPEPEAVALAADCTANDIFRERGQRAIAALRQGAKLTDAVQMVDDAGEFHWRLSNALHAHKSFFTALAGWNESLDAKAYQQEQATAQVVTTGLVLLNGVLVGFIVVSVFSILVSVINIGLLW